MAKGICFILGPGNVVLGHNELKYALRSLEFLPEGFSSGVWAVGLIPPWLRNVHTIEVPRNDGARHEKWRHAKANLQAIVESEETPDEIVIWHDDMMLTRPVEELPLFHVGTLAEHASRVKAEFPDSGYVTALLDTRRLLQGQGVADPLSFESHTPFPHTKQGLREALGLCAGRPRLHERSIDGNLRGLSVPQSSDVKIYDDDGPVTFPALVSFSDRSWRQKAGSRIRQLLREPSRYERASRR